MGAKVKPGTTVEVTWNLYNLYGDRTTHITITKTSGPDWKITYEPPLHTGFYDVSGVIVNKTENIEIENSSVVLEIPANVPNDTVYVKHPNLPGYILTKPIKMYITVPENAKLFQNYNFTFQAKGDCFNAPGSVIPAAALQFKVAITPTNEYSEKPVSNAKGTAGTATGFSILGLGTATSILSITTIVFIIVLLFLLIKGARKSAKEKAQSSNKGDSSQGDNKSQSGDNSTMSIGFSSP
jgi:hypothetical protein